MHLNEEDTSPNSLIVKNNYFDPKMETNYGFPNINNTRPQSKSHAQQP